MPPEAIVGIVSAVIGPLVAYLLAARRFSGKIQTSDARQLWEESRDIRKWSTARIKVLNERVADLERQVAELGKQFQQCQAELLEERARLSRLRTDHA